MASFDLMAFLKEEVDIGVLIEEVTYHAETVGSAAEKQPKLYVEASRLHAQKYNALGRAKLKLKEIEATRALAIREDMAASANGERVTEGKISAAVDLDPEVMKARRNLVRAETFELYTKLMLEAYKMRRDGIANTINLQQAEFRYQQSQEGDSQVEKIKKRLEERYPGRKKKK